jgi:hypothetical protein
MKKHLTKIVLATLMAAAPLAASDEYLYNTNSLFALEGGFGGLNAASAGGAGLGSPSFGSFGLKIGAESKSYRIFFNGNYNAVEDFDYAYTYGVAVQYKFNFTEIANFYLGVNGGYANMQTNAGTSISDPYFGGDAGFNIHASKLIDVELGARMLKVNNDLVDNMVNGYASVIFKYQMD